MAHFSLTAGSGTACTRAGERTAAAIGPAGGAATRFEPATGVALGGVLCGLPALCANGLFSDHKYAKSLSGEVRMSEVCRVFSRAHR